VDAVNAAWLCGKNDWRLPTVDELHSIVDYSKAVPGPAINTTWFANTPNSSYYWTSSPVVGGSNLAWFVSFGNGSVINFGSSGGYLGRSLAYQVRLVRSSP
jgi:hypothetical protein